MYSNKFNHKRIAPIITKGIFIGALVEFLPKITYLLYLDFSARNTTYANSDIPRKNCFGGLQFAILLSLTLFLMIMSLPSFFNLFARVRNSRILSFTAHFGLHILYLGIIICSIDGISGEDIFLLLPWLYLFSWIITYRKLRSYITSSIV